MYLKISIIFIGRRLQDNFDRVNEQDTKIILEAELMVEYLNKIFSVMV